MIIPLPTRHFDAHRMQFRPPFFSPSKGGLKTVFLALDAGTMARGVLSPGMDDQKGETA